MSAGTGRIALAAAAALAAHVLAAVLFYDAPVLGTERFASDVAEAAGRPEYASPPECEPTRVVLGRASRVPFEGPGPRAALEPAAVRRPPALGRLADDEEARRALVVPLFHPDPGEATTPMRAEPPGSDAPSWSDGELSLASVELDLKSVIRRLAASAAAAVSLPDLAKRTLLELEPERRALSLKLDAGPPPLPIPTEWHEPARALHVPEVFVDVLETASP